MTGKVMFPFVIVMLITTRLWSAEDESSKSLYRSLERHLQTLKSLEIHYRVTGAAPEGVVSGRMIFVKPDRFYHDTPAWSMCEHGTEQWRYLKDQQTVILERSEAREWLPETLLMNIGKDLKPAGLITESDGRVLLLRSGDALSPGGVNLYFAQGKKTPNAIQYEMDDGTVVRYDLDKWLENEDPAETLFEAPVVSPENLIDFRQARP